MARSLDQLPPEILLAILDEMDMSELSSVIRVNRQFFNLGIRILWQVQSDIYLVKVPKSRRRVYIPWIMELSLSRSPKVLYKRFKDFVFPNVKELRVTLKDHQGPIADCRYLTHFMNPGLQLLRLEGDITADFLLDVQNQCPKLRTVICCSCGPCVRPTDFLTFVRGLPYLERLDMHEKDGHTMIDSKVIGFLATSQRIEQLSLDRITPEMLRDALSLEAPFPEMMKLDIEIRQDAVASMVEIFNSIFALRVTLKATNTWETEIRSRALRPLSELSRVRSLDIFVDGDMRIAPEDLVSLRSLSDLRRLTIEGLHARNLRAADFGDDDLHRLVSGLPGLDTLSLQFLTSGVTSASFATLAKCCPRLGCCDLGGAFNALDLRDYKAPLLPKLGSLRVGCFLDSDIRGIDDEADDHDQLVENRACEHARQLERHFPKASIWIAQNGGYPAEVQFSMTVVKLFRREYERDSECDSRPLDTCIP
ncbi:uncharacterized protein CDV56_108213 [Aspergillus thermomutatus]|uniref:F-box domain-containing protein n=1 Tax=Aspergillus thermomutatus TaxID=41047 RepID=A0A397HEG3_ASPTH|nr:uncharacterized protein CDV56_108213 [Aspergillus thermomutatus]RHZ61462.1 hypothetical protein CDV56_108213 [Aspergillus thermomutatus]